MSNSNTPSIPPIWNSSFTSLYPNFTSTSLYHSNYNPNNSDLILDGYGPLLPNLPKEDEQFYYEESVCGKYTRFCKSKDDKLILKLLTKSMIK